jgi:hypothetical protein
MRRRFEVVPGVQAQVDWVMRAPAQLDGPVPPERPRGSAPHHQRADAAW